MRYSAMIVAFILAVVMAAGCSTSVTPDIPGSDVPAYNGPPGTGGIVISIPKDVAEAMVETVSSRFPLWSYLHVPVREVSTQAILAHAWPVNTGAPQMVQIGGITAGKVVDIPVDLYAGGNTGVIPPSGGTWATAGLGGPVTIIKDQNVNVPTIFLQAKPPGVTSVTPVDGSTVPASFTFGAQVSPGSAASGTPTSSVAGVSRTSTSPSWNLGPFANGPLTVELAVVDTSSTSSSNGRITRTVSYTVSGGGGGGDITPPDTNITSGPSGTVATPNVTFQWTGTDNIDPPSALVYSYQLDGGGWSNYDSAIQVSYSGLADGSHTFDVRARDISGNVDSTPASRSFTVDTSGGGGGVLPQFANWQGFIHAFTDSVIAPTVEVTAATAPNATVSTVQIVRQDDGSGRRLRLVGILDLTNALMVGGWSLVEVDGVALNNPGGSTGLWNYNSTTGHLRILNVSAYADGYNVTVAQVDVDLSSTVPY